MLLLFFMLTVISSASIVPSRLDYMTKQRRQRQRNGDPWIAQALNRICHWAECQGWIGCTQSSNPAVACSETPTNFIELEPFVVLPPRRTSLGTCYGYSPPGNPARLDWCKDGPKKDECACINSERILRIGYSEEGRRHPQYDAPIGDLCASRITSLCSTPPITTTALTTAPSNVGNTSPCTSTAVTPGALVSSLVISTDASSLSPSTTTTTSAPFLTIRGDSSRLVPSTTTYVPSPNEGSTYLDHWYIWPPLVVVVALALCLLVALYRRRSNFTTTPAEVTSRGGNGVELDENGYLAVSRFERKVSPTHDNDNVQTNVAAYEDLKSNDPGGYAELRPYQQLKISEGRSAELLLYEEPKISNGGSAELVLYEEPKANNGGSAELVLYEEPKTSNGGSAEHLPYEEPKVGDGGSAEHQQVQHPLCEPIIRSYDHAEPYAQV